MKASLLTVGTEITSGQILNENARVLSQYLQKLGIDVLMHLSVPDDRALILEALKSCADQSDIMFVTGGLGPTSDDFTRDLINSWARPSVELQFHPPSWEKVQKRLQERGMVAHEFQKQQCYYPKDSVVLDNSQGTANGFYLQAHNKHLWALPGPPNEIEALWSQHVLAQIQKFPLDPKMTKSWDVMGIGENQLSHLVEPALKDFPGEIGYRVHQPYVEFKLIYFQSQKSQVQNYAEKIEEILKPYTVTRDGQDISLQFCQLLLGAPHMTIIDDVTDGRWLVQLAPHMKTVLSRCQFTYTKNKNFSPEGWYAKLLSTGDDKCELEISNTEKTSAFKLTTPLNSPALNERKKLYFAEVAMLKVVESWNKTKV